MYTLEFNDSELTSLLDGLGRGLEDLSPLMQEIGEYMVRTTKQLFVEGTTPEGVPWAPKALSTIDAYTKRRDRADPRPLFGPSGVLSSGISYVAGRDSVEWGSSRIYAAVMQFGADQGEFGAFMGKDKLGRDHFHHIPWGDIPARPFLGVSDSDREGILAIVAEYIEDLSQGR